MAQPQTGKDMLSTLKKEQDKMEKRKVKNKINKKIKKIVIQ